MVVDTSACLTGAGALVPPVPAQAVSASAAVTPSATRACRRGGVVICMTFLLYLVVTSCCGNLGGLHDDKGVLTRPNLVRSISSSEWSSAPWTTASCWSAETSRTG